MRVRILLVALVAFAVGCVVGYLYGDRAPEMLRHLLSFVVLLVTYFALRHLGVPRIPRSYVYDCPNCGCQVQDIVARTDAEWREWCLVRGGCQWKK